MRKEFKSYEISKDGLAVINMVKERFSDLLEEIEKCAMNGRELALTKTKLEEAAFYATRAIAEKYQESF